MNTERTSSPHEGIKQAEAYLQGILENKAKLNNLLREAILFMAEVQIKRDAVQKAVKEAGKTLKDTNDLIVEEIWATEEAVEYTKKLMSGQGSSRQEITPQDYERGKVLLSMLEDVAKNLNNLNLAADNMIEVWC